MAAVQKPEHYFDPPVVDLVRAALRHDAAMVKASSADPNTVGREKMTPLIYAVLSQDLEAIKGLLHAGADANQLVPQTGTAAGIAAKLEDTTALTTLLDNGVSAQSLEGSNPLSWSAARADNRVALEILFRHGLSIDARNESRGETVLIDALSVNDADLANWLVDHGANVRVVDVFFISAASFVQRALSGTGGSGPKSAQYQALQTKFERRGVQFPVPTSPELKRQLGRNKVSVEEAAHFNERGQTV